MGEHAECRIREFFLGGDFEGQALHSGAFELYAHPGAQVDLAHYQDWGRGEIYDLSTRRVEVRRDARVKWVPIHLGGRLTKQRLDIVTAEPGSDMKHTGLYFTERDEHLDLFTSDLHEAGHTTGDTVWKGALTGESRASYEGLIHIVPKARGRHLPPDPLDAALAEGEGDAIPSLIVEVDNVKASHGGTVGELDQDQIFYMMTRSVRRGGACARRGLLRGGSPAARGSRPRGARAPPRGQLHGAEDQVREFIGERGGHVMGALATKTGRRARRLPGARARVRRQAARLPGLRRHLAEARQVIDAIGRYYSESNANIHRGVYALAREATDLYEGARGRGRVRRRRRGHHDLHQERHRGDQPRGVCVGASTSRRATRCSSRTWSTTRTSCPGSCSARRRARSSATSRCPTRASSRSTSSTSCWRAGA